MVDLVAKVGSAVLPTLESFICIEAEPRSGRCSSVTPGARF